MTEELVKFHPVSNSAIKAEIEIKAPPEKVFAAWTQPDQLVKWFGPREGGRLQIDTFDCKLGGRFDVTMHFSDGDKIQLIGEYQEVEPSKKLVFTWQWTESPAFSNETLVTVDISATETGSLLTLTHERFLTEGDRNDHQQGWEPILVRLAAVLAGK